MAVSDLDTQLLLLKTDLGLMRVTDDQKTYLSALLTTAASAITREGITLTAENLECNTLVATYAAWLYRKRAANGNTSFAVGMPRMLRWQLNNLLVSQKMAEPEVLE